MISGAPLQVAVEQDGDIVRVACAGEIDMGTAPTLESALEQARTLATSSLVLDLSAVTFFDSQGVRIVASLTRWSATTGVPMRLETSDIVRRVLEIAGIDGWISTSH